MLLGQVESLNSIFGQVEIHYLIKSKCVKMFAIFLCKIYALASVYSYFMCTSNWLSQKLLFGQVEIQFLVSRDELLVNFTVWTEIKFIFLLLPLFTVIFCLPLFTIM